MRKVPLRKVSTKRKKMNDEWANTCINKMQQQRDTRGYAYCEICGLPEKNWEGGKLWGHHKNKDRTDNSIGNCEITHWVCHFNKYHSGMKQKERWWDVYWK